MKVLGSILIGMTAEEVAELIDDDEGDVEVEVEGDEELAFGSPAQKAFVSLARLARRARAHEGARYLTKLEARILGPIMALRTGKVLSSENEQCLRDAHAKIIEGCEMVMSVVALNQQPDASESGDAGDDEEKALRARRADGQAGMGRPNFMPKSAQATAESVCRDGQEATVAGASPREISPFVCGAPDTMSSSTSFSLVCAIALSPTFSPRFSTITRSPTSKISFMRCEMMICATLWRLSSSMVSNLLSSRGRNSCFVVP